MPGWYGMAQVKWLTRIEVLDRPFDGFQNATAYRLKVDAGDPGEPVTRIRPRALLAPPGWPDFMTRDRFVRAGRVVAHRAGVVGPGAAHRRRGEHGRRCVVGAPPISPPPIRRTRTPGGRGPTPGRRRPGPRSCWSVPPTPRAPQPVEQDWNRQGMANNLVQRVPVTVLDPA